MVNIENKIHNSEDKYKDLLEKYFTSVYPDNKLPSHGLNHHCRVWEYAKELIGYLIRDIELHQDFIDKLLIASYLHDIGMAVSSDSKHGHFSSEFCKSFLRKNNMDPNKYKDLIYAIENHDNKDYDLSADDSQLLIILSVADDLDAFGETGISRYIEIYQERGIQPNLLSAVVMENAKKRYENFERIFNVYPDLIEKHKSRYLILSDYFSSIKT